MAEKQSFRRVDLSRFDQIRESERPTLRIRWWVLLLAVVLCIGQAVLCVVCEHMGSRPQYPIATEISVLAFAFLAVIALLINPLLRCLKIVTPLNRGELMAMFAALMVSAGISSFGLADQLVPLVATPFNPKWNIAQRKWDQDVIPHLNRNLFITDTDVIDEYRSGPDIKDDLWRKIPWKTWAKPLGAWMVFVLAVYALFYSLSSLVYDTWAKREKLVFPLARLPEDLMHDEGKQPGTWPSSLKTGIFWIGFSIAALVLLYNASVASAWIEGLKAMPLGISTGNLQAMLRNTPFNGIADDAQFRLVIMFTFTAIGIGFLLPLDISRSLWGYFLVAIGLLMVAIWLAFGSSVRSFPSDWLWENSFLTSLGAGGLLAFSASILVKLVAEKWSVARERAKSSGANAFGGFIRSFGWGGAFFLLSLIVSLAWLYWSGVSLVWALIFMAIVILVTIGLMRVVAEGGIYWFQIHTGPFHLAKMAGGAKSIPAKALAPLMSVYSVLFMETKTYMAPNVINSYKMQDETRASRRMFHAVVWASIIATIIAAVVTMLYVIYNVGADRASNWFFTSGPQDLIDKTQLLVGAGMAETGRYNYIFYIVGAVWVIASIFARRRFFWWLHPIGFAMLANPLMSQLWFSFFLGWLFKKITVKYGGRHMFARVRPFFVGLIFGELLTICAWILMARFTGWSTYRMSMNVYNP